MTGKNCQDNQRNVLTSWCNLYVAMKVKYQDKQQWSYLPKIKYFEFFYSLKGSSLGHSLYNSLQISVVREWLIRDTIFMNNFCLTDFLISHKTWPKFNNFWCLKNRFWTIENHPILLKIHSKHIEIEFLSCCMLK